MRDTLFCLSLYRPVKNHTRFRRNSVTLYSLWLEFITFFGILCSSHLQSLSRDERFKYAIVPNAIGLFDVFRVHALPVHVVIDKSGNVSFTLTGTDEAIYDILSDHLNKIL